MFTDTLKTKLLRTIAPEEARAQDTRRGAIIARALNALTLGAMRDLATTLECDHRLIASDMEELLIELETEATEYSYLMHQGFRPIGTRGDRR